MKTVKYMLTTIIALFLGGCSDESAIEGLIPAKPKSIELNKEVLKNTGYKEISFSIENNNFTFMVGHFIRDNQFTFDIEISPFQTGSNPLINFSALPSSPTIKYVAFGEVIDYDSLKFAASSILTKGTISPGPVYNYLYPNTAKFNNKYYLPFKINSTGDLNGTIGWLLITLTEDKIVFNKLAYVKNSTIKAGEE